MDVLHHTDEKEMFGYRFSIDQTCTNSYHSGEQWGEWSESYVNRSDAYIRKENKYPDVVCPYKLDSGDSAFVVWVEYSTGDSFGHGERNATETIAMFKDIKAALDLKNKLEKHAKDEGYEYDLQCLDGQNIKSGFASWKGYFDHLDEVHVTPVVLLED